MEEEYYSCRWLQGGLAFNRRSIHACLIAHHDRGLPHLCDYAGGELPVLEILRARSDLVERNRKGEETDCTGCPHLVKKQWVSQPYAFDIVGVAHFSLCNIECNYRS